MEDSEIVKSFHIIVTHSHALCSSWGASPLWKVLGRNLEVCWYAIQALSVKYGLGNNVQRRLETCFMSVEEAFRIHLRWKEHQCKIQLERASMYLLPGPEAPGSDCESAETTCPSPASLADIFGIELPSQKTKSDDCHKRFILTDSVQQNLQACAFALAEGRPLLLEGPPGAGKSMLIGHLASSTANESVVTLHLDDKLDSKSLLGSYVCGTTPGEFCWQDGPLTQAVKKGLWLVLEDIDYASFELVSALQTLLQERVLNIPSRGDVIEAAHGFQLFATMSIGPGSTARNPATRDFLASKFYVVEVKPLPVKEVESVLTSLYPELVGVLPQMLCALCQLNMAAMGRPTEVIQDDLQARRWLDLMKGQAPMFCTAMGNGFRGVSMRELCCWCNRIVEFHRQHLSLIRVGIPVPSSVREKITMEGIDVLIGSISRDSVYSACLEGLANSFALPQEFIVLLADSWKPKLDVGEDYVQIGRASLFRSSTSSKDSHSERYIHTGHVLRLMERVGVAVQLNEPVLLVGETGTGKTALVQHLASVCGERLLVINMSQQTDSSDFLGGFRPLGIEETVRPLLEKFLTLFPNSFSSAQNMPFLQRVQKYASKKRWAALLKAFVAAGAKALSELSKGLDCLSIEPSLKRRKANPSLQLEEWKHFYDLSRDAESKLSQYTSGSTFAFVEGILVRALRDGCWLLLDEINLAPAETLERIAGVLESPTGSLVLTERGDLNRIERSPKFRLFACMNPGTDVGKKSLPPQLRSRFTEIPAPEPKSFEDLHVLVSGLLSGTIPGPPVTPVVNFYLKCKSEAGVSLLDSGDGKPQYSLRALYRALEYTRAASPLYGFNRALFDGFSMAFLTLLKSESVIMMERFLEEILMCQKSVVGLNRAPACPGNEFIQFDSFWVRKGEYPVDSQALAGFIVTPTISIHLKNLARAVLLCKYPILLQGPTSSGKTSLVGYLAGATGHRLLRINNHEHTDLSEYMGSYVTTTSGGLHYQEGLLVQAMRKGFWIVLDELNLAPTEVLEALNRLLDDNRELFIPDTQETVKPHPHFMLFATQNPPGIYGGRKPLSQAFRSRFLEIHVDEIPDDELVTILEQRCLIPKTYARKMTEVQKDLQRHRGASLVFAGKHGLVTPRILFKWAERHSNGYQELAEDGIALLAERLRLSSEREYVKQAIEKVLRVKVDMHDMFTRGAASTIQKLEDFSFASLPSRIVWTASLQRLLCLVARCVSNGEHVLLVGDTGCGKTTACQLVAAAFNKELYTVNCHKHTEASDFIGGYRPARAQELARGKLQELIFALQSDADLAKYVPNLEANDDIDKVLQALNSVLEKATADGWGAKVHGPRGLLQHIGEINREGFAPFVWEDGPLVKAMQGGDFLLIDELSLAEDAVLERLNSVLEPEKKLMIAEKGGSACEVLGKDDFVIFATMNPGGDFGKRELSPALRSRFTEIWVPPVCSRDELWSIVNEQLTIDGPERSAIADAMLDFWMDFTSVQDTAMLAAALSVRDLLSWAAFINATFPTLGHWKAFLHGAHLAFIDGIGIGQVGLLEEKQGRALALVSKSLPGEERDKLLETCCFQNSSPEVAFDANNGVTIGPFKLPTGYSKLEYPARFDLTAPTVSKNALKVARALQVSKPILLEGSPGVGKTSLIAALARASGNGFVRINLSEQTDVMDLLGADLPAEGDCAGEFVWSDGPLLHAIKNGQWVLLDELNLASQSVLEGLNALLDHRQEVYIPELSTSFRPKEGFRVFGAQNPATEGGGRKGLPRSFLNRFTKVWCYPLQETDLCTICLSVFPSMPQSIVENMVRFNTCLHEAVSVKKRFGSMGSPWEFNLRDVLRWCELLYESYAGRERDPALLTCDEVYTVMSPLYLQRMRAQQDKEEIKQLFMSIFGCVIESKQNLPFFAEMGKLHIGSACLPIQGGTCSARKRKERKSLLLPGDKEAYETAAHCLASNWLCIVVGPQGSGKTAFVRNLSLLSNNTLLECNLTSGTDANDILGGFEQRDFERHVSEVEQAVCQCCADAIIEMLSCISSENCQSLLLDLLETSSALEEHMLETSTNSRSDLRRRLESLMSILNRLQACTSLPGSKNLNVLKIAKQVESLHVEARNGPSIGSAGTFEWVDGVVTRAMEQGHWVVLEGANLCNPAVLDRLNPVLESGGELLINEAGIIDGHLRIIRPHPNFRLFLTLDPRFGEVSRAMRNRGVEVYVSAPIGISNTSRVETVLSVAQIPGQSLRQAISAAHTSVCELLRMSHFFELSLTDVERFATLFLTLLYRGSSLKSSFVTAWSCTYLHRIPQYAAIPEQIEAIKEDCLSKITSPVEHSLFNSSNWPFLVALEKFAQDPTSAVVEQDTALYVAISAETNSMHTCSQSNTESELPSTGILSSLNADQLVRLPTVYIKKVLGFDMASHPGLPCNGGHALEALKLMQHFAGLLYIERAQFGDRTARLGHLKNLAKDGPRVVFGNHSMASRLVGIANTVFEDSMIHDALQKRLFLNFLWHNSMLREMEEGLQRDPLSGKPSFLQQSCWLQIRPNDTSLGCKLHACVDWLYPFILLLDQLIGHEIRQNFDRSNKLIEQLFLWRNALVRSSNSLAPDTQELALCFLKCVKSKNAICGKFCTANAKLYDRIDYIEEGLRSALGLSCLSSKPILWKNSGKPRVPRSQEILDYQERLFWVCEQFMAGSPQRLCLHNADQLLCRNEAFPFCANYSLKKEACEGVALLEMHMYGSDASIDFQKLVDFLERSVVKEIQQQEEQEREGEEERHTSCVVALQNAEEMHSQAFPLRRGDNLSCLEFQFLLSKIEETRSLSAEQEAIQKVLECVLRSALSLAGEWKECANALEKFVHTSLAGAARSPYDYASAMLIVWGATEAELPNGPTPDQEVLFKEQLQRLLWTYHRARWHGLNGFDTVQSLLERSSIAREICTDQPVQTRMNMRTFSLLYFQDTTPGNLATRKVQLKRFVRCCMDGWMDRSKQAELALERRIVIQLLIQVILEFHSTYERQCWKELELCLGNILQMAAKSHAGNSNAHATISRLETILLTTNNVAFKELSKKLLVPAAFNLFPEHAVDVSAAQLGHSWVLLGLLRLHLVRPPSVVDPSYKATHKCNILRASNEELASEFQVRKLYEACPYKTYVDGCLVYVSDAHCKRGMECLKMEGKIVARPGPSIYPELQMEVDRFVEGIADVDRISNLAKDLVMNAQAEASEIQQKLTHVKAFQATSLQFLDKSLSRYFLYADILQPVQLAVYELKTGFSLIASSVEKSWQSSTRQSTIGAVQSLMSFPQALSYDCCHVQTLCYLPAEELSICSDGGEAHEAPRTRQTNLGRKMAVLLASMRWIALSGRCHEGFYTGHYQLVESLLQEMHASWKELKDYLEAEEKEASAVFKYKGLSIDPLKEEEDEEEEYRKRFPDHREIFEDLVAADVSPEDSSERKMKSATEGLLQQRNEKEALKAFFEGSCLSEVIRFHSLIFGSQKLDALRSDQLRTASFMANYKVAMEVLKGSAMEDHDDSLPCLAGHLMHVSLDLKAYQVSPLDDQSLAKDVEALPDFHHDSNPAEASLVEAPVSRLREKIQWLLQEWPENAVLLELDLFCKRLLGIKLLLPLKSFSTGLELLLSKTQIWEESTASHVSLRDEIVQLAALARRWRKLELHSWRQALECTAKRQIILSHQSWLHLLGALNSVLHGELEATDITSSLQDFVMMSTVGQFKARIRYLSAFQGQMKLTQGQESLSSDSKRRREQLHILLSNVANFFGRYESEVEGYICEHREKIEKEMEEFIRLARWEDRGYYALKESADKSSRTIHRLCRKFQDVLSTQIICIVEQRKDAMGIADLSKEVHLHKGEEPTRDETENVSEPYERERHWALGSAKIAETLPMVTACTLDNQKRQAATYVPRIHALTKTMGQHFRDCFTAQNGVPKITEFLEMLSASLAEQVHALQRDKNAKKQRKKKALTDFLHAFRDLGLSRRQMDLKCKGSSSWMLSPPIPEFPIADKSISTMLPKLDKYFYESRAIVQQVFELEWNANADLSPEEVESGVSFADQLVHLQELQRNSIAEHAKWLLLLRQCIGSIPSLPLPMTSGKKKDYLQDAKENYEDPIQEICAVNTAIADLHCLVHELISLETLAERKAVLESVSFALEKLRCAAGVFVNEWRQVQQQCLLHECVYQVYSQKLSKVDGAREEFQDNLMLLKQAAEVAKQREAYVPGLDLLIGRVEAMQLLLHPRALLSFNTVDMGDCARQSTSYAEQLQVLDNCVRETLLWSQKVVRYLSRHNNTSEGMKKISLAENVSQQQSLLGSHHIPCIVQDLKSVVLSASGEHASSAKRECTWVLLQQSLPFFKTLLVTYETLFTEYLHLHKAVAKLGYIGLSSFIEILKNGFCGPVEESTKSVDPGKTKEIAGTGVGEGKGAKDVSDEIENEDQVLGNESRKDKAEEEDADVDKNDGAKGIEMEQDFAGELGDVTGDGEDEEDDQEEGAELDKQLGDFSDGEDIDERMWGEDDKSDGSKPQDGDGGTVEEQKGDVDVRGNADDEDEGGDNQDKSKGQDNALDEASQDEEDESLSQELPRDREDAPPNNFDIEAEDDFDLPDEMALDGQDDGDGGDQEDCPEEEGTISEGGPEQDVAESMALSDGEEEGGEGSDKDDDAVLTDPHDVDNATNEDTDAAANRCNDKEHDLQEERPNVLQPPPDAKQPNQRNKEEELLSSEGLPQSSMLENQAGNSKPGDASQPDMQPSLQAELDHEEQAPGMEEAKPDSNMEEEMDFNHDPRRSGQSSQGAQEADARPSESHEEQTNATRTLADAIKDWTRRLAADKNDHAEVDDAEPYMEEGADGMEYEFEQQKGKEEDGIQSAALAAATEEQVVEMQEGAAERVVSTIQEREDLDGTDLTHLPSCMEEEEEAMNNIQMDADHGNAGEHDGACEKTDTLNAGKDRKDSHVSSLAKEKARVEDIGFADAIRDDERANTLAQAAQENPYSGQNTGSERWMKYEKLSSHISGELVEQLRLLLEPTVASKLGGEYKTGKRINMRKVISYIASKYKKDKIWMRRTKPDKRKYQVVVAIDDSMSMTENNCAHFALESVALIANALSRLDVGELGIVSWGGKRGVELKHPLDQPFTQQCGARMLEDGFCFDQDNTIADKPAGELLSFLDDLLQDARDRVDSGYNMQLQQLVLILADGHFHEKESLRRKVRQMMENKGLLLAFIVLDSPNNSLMDMQSVSFEEGRPVFQKYMDSFPFPYYIVLGETASLPRTLADLLRQWFECCIG